MKIIGNFLKLGTLVILVLLISHKEVKAQMQVTDSGAIYTLIDILTEVKFQNALTEKDNEIKNAKDWTFYSDTIAKYIEMLKNYQMIIQQGTNALKNGTSQLDYIKQLRTAMYDNYNQFAGAIGETYRTFQMTQKALDPTQYQNILDDKKKEWECLMQDLDDIKKVDTLWKAKYSFSAQEYQDYLERYKANHDDQVKIDDSENNQILGQENPFNVGLIDKSELIFSSGQQNLSRCGQVIDFAQSSKDQLKIVDQKLNFLDTDLEAVRKNIENKNIANGSQQKDEKGEYIVALTGTPDDIITQAVGKIFPNSSLGLKSYTSDIMDQAGDNQQEQERKQKARDAIDAINAKIVSGTGANPNPNQIDYLRTQLIVQKGIYDKLKILADKTREDQYAELRNARNLLTQNAAERTQLNNKTFGDSKGITVKEYVSNPALYKNSENITDYGIYKEDNVN